MAMVMISNGDPYRWMVRGNKLYYDMNVDSQKWLRMDYYRLPHDMSDDSDVPEISEQFHWGIVLWGMRTVYRQLMESAQAYSLKQDLIEFMRQTVSSYEMRDDRIDIGGYIRGDYTI